MRGTSGSSGPYSILDSSFISHCFVLVGSKSGALAEVTYANRTAALRLWTTHVKVKFQPEKMQTLQEGHHLNTQEVRRDGMFDRLNHFKTAMR